MSEPTHELDRIDLKILNVLQADGRLTNLKLAEAVALSPTAVLARVQRLIRGGYIQGYEARLDPGPLGRKLLAYVFVRSDELPGEALTGDRLAAIPEVLEVHHVAGEDCYLAKVRCSDTEELGRLLRQRFGSIPTVRSTRTTIVLGTLKESGKLPLPDRPAGEEEHHD